MAANKINASNDIVVEPTEDEIILDVGPVNSKPYNIKEETFKHIIWFDKKITWLGIFLITSYVLILVGTTILFLIKGDKIILPPFFDKYESIVQILIGFFFGTRLVSKYLESQ
jgi:hypothetical protein